MNEVHNHIFKVDTTCIKDNQVLAMSVNRQDVERCTRVIRQYGILMPPVIGNFKDGTQLVLSGECELMALKEMGIKSVDAVAVPIVAEEEGDKLALLLSCLRKSPNALSEAIFIAQLLKTGQYNQLQLSEMLGKSTSWVNKRISLVTRLHPAVKEMVMMNQLCPHSAQDISRLPQDVQYDFSTKIISDGLPKSAIELLVAAFNKEDCPSSLNNSGPQIQLFQLNSGPLYQFTIQHVRIDLEVRRSEKGIAIAHSTTTNFVRELRNKTPETFLKLSHEPGETIQFDWGDMTAVIAQLKTVVSIFCAALPFSGHMTSPSFDLMSVESL